MKKGDEYLSVAACKGNTELDFFSLQPKQIKACRALCATCQGKTGCLEAAMRYESGGEFKRWGIWGGTTPQQRARLAARRAAKVRR